MIITKIRGGLGNQLFTYAAGRALSIQHKCPLLLDTSWYNDGFRPLMLEHFNITADMSFDDHSNSDDGIGFNQEHWQYYPEFEIYDGHRFLSGWWQSEKFFKNAAADIRNDFTFRDPSLTKAAQQQISTECSDRTRSGPIVGMHCRRGDYVGLAESNMFALMTPTYYREAMKRFPDDSTFLLFSDDPVYCSVHFDDERIVVVDQEDALLTFAMMQQCDHIIIANSSFSWWAAWLGEKPGTKVVSPLPSQWFGPNIDQNRSMIDMVPDRWITIEDDRNTEMNESHST